MASEVSKLKNAKPGIDFNASIKTIDSEADSRNRRPVIERELRSSLTGSFAHRPGGKQEGTPGHDRLRKIGHRRVDEAGQVTYKKKSTTELMAAIQLGIGQSITNLASRPKRDLLLQDFSIVETVSFPRDGSSVTPTHTYSDFRFRSYAPVAFRYFRELFNIQPDDFLLSLSNYPLQELSNPGASGSIFYITDDDEFIIKTVQHKEAEFLQKLLPGYYMNLNQNPRTLLPKFFGLFCYQCGGKNIRFVIMNNLLPSSIRMHEKYDMKGSTYKRKASRQERAKSSPTLKDLDFIALHPDGLMLEAETFSALVKTIDRDCRVLQSFQIMDYSLLMSVHNLDQAVRDREMKDLEGVGGGGDVDSPTGQSTCASVDAQGGLVKAVTRGRSIHQRLAQFSTTMEAIHAKAEPLEIDEDEIPPGGIPARNFRGERLLLYIGIIDILQSYRLAKKLEHAFKSLVHDGDAISVHRPGFYAQRFESFCGNSVFKKIPSLDQPQVKGSHVRFKKLVQIAMRHSPSHRKSVTSSGKVAGSGSGDASAAKHSESETGGVGGRPDVLPSATPPPTSSMAELNLASNESDAKTTLQTAELAPSDATERSYFNYSPANTAMSTPTHTSFTEGTPSYTASSPSCCSDVLASRASSCTTDSLPRTQCSNDAAAAAASDLVVLEGSDVDATTLDSLSREVNAAMVDLANRISDESVDRESKRCGEENESEGKLPIQL